MKKPFPQSYWVLEGIFCAGHYPADLDPVICQNKFTGLLDCGIERVLNLTLPGETGRGGIPFLDYIPPLSALAAERDKKVTFYRYGIRDTYTPTTELMRQILDTIDEAVGIGSPIYIHCWGGHGRTGTVASCWLMRNGMEPEEAINKVCALRKDCPKNHYPLEGKQAQFVHAYKDR